MTAEDHYYTGVDLFGEGKHDEAIAEYQEALALDPKFADALHGLAQAHYAKNDFDNAIAAAQRILELDPDDILAWTTISRSLQRQGLVPQAEEAGNKARVLGLEETVTRPKARSPARKAERFKALVDLDPSAYPSRKIRAITPPLSRGEIKNEAPPTSGIGVKSRPVAAALPSFVPQDMQPPAAARKAMRAVLFCRG